jgi:hypothetical protein
VAADRSSGITDVYLAAVRRHVEALADPLPGRDERGQARHEWTHWFAVQRLARAAEIEVLEREMARQAAERGA